jgi:hypothetical protein
MIAEFAAYYGGPPAAAMAWPLFLALYQRTPLFEARRQLTALIGTGGAIGSAFGGDNKAAQELFQRAYPVKHLRPLQTWVKNQAAEA